MPVYLAYQFGPRQLTRKRLRRILEDWVDFDLPDTGLKSPEDFFKEMKELVEGPISSSKMRGKTLLEKTGETRGMLPIREYPLLFLFIGYCKEFRTLGNFRGVYIGDCHTLQAVPEMERLKPTMDAYLRNIGINYEDRSKTSLD